MKLSIRITSIILAFVLVFSLCACSDEAADTTSTTDTNTSVTDKTEDNGDASDVSSDNQTTSSTDTPSSNSSIVENNSSVTSDVSSVESEATTNPNASAQPTITLLTPVANDIFIIGGNCSNNTEYIQISGDSVKTQKVVPARGKDKSYFTAQVQIKNSDYVFIQTKEKGKEGCR